MYVCMYVDQEHWPLYCPLIQHSIFFILLIVLYIKNIIFHSFCLYVCLSVCFTLLSPGSVFWSTLVTWVNGFARIDYLPEDQQYYLSVIILLMFLLILPFIFDTLARNYEGMKLESEIQNAIMTRYYYDPVIPYHSQLLSISLSMSMSLPTTVTPYQYNYQCCYHHQYQYE